MKRLLALIIAITALALVCPVLAQPGPEGGSTEPGGGMAPGRTTGRGLRQASMGRGAAAGLLTVQYDPKTVTTVKGDVESLGTLPPTPRGGVTYIRNAVLKTEEGNVTVYLCPDYFLNQQNITLKAGVRLEVTGSKITMNGQPSVIAKDLKVGEKTVALRDDKGDSLWPLLKRPSRKPPE